MRKWSELPAVLRYGAAIAAVAAAVAAGLMQQVVEITPVVSLLLCGVLFAAWFGGLGPGLLAIILGVLAFDYFFLPPLYSPAVQSHDDVLRLIAFAITALFVVVLSARQESTAQSLRRSEKNLQTIIETIPALVLRYRSDGTPDFVNQTLREFVGPSVGHDGMRSAVHPDDLPQNLRDWSAHAAAGEPYENEMRLRRADGAYRWHRIRRVPLRDESGSIVSWYGAGFDIDDQRRAEAALREREARLAEAQRELQVMIDTIPVMVASYDSDGSLNYVNKTALDFTGVAEVDMAERQRIMAHPDDFDQIRSQWRATVAKGEPFETERRLRRCDGEYRWISTRRAPLRDSGGTIVKWYSAAIDIEDRKRAELALKKSEAELIEAKRELQATIDTIPAMVASYWPNGERDFVNLAWQRFTGISQEEARGTTKQLILTHPDHRALGPSRWRRSLETGEPFELEEQLLRVDGQHRWHWVRRVPARDENGKVIKWYGIGHDVEDQKRAETALRESEYKLRQIIDTVPGLLWSNGPDGEPTHVSQRMLDYSGMRFEDFKHRGWEAFVHPADFPETARAFSHAIQIGTSYQGVMRLRRADGEFCWHDARCEPLRDRQGRIVQWYGLSVEIDEAKKAEDRLRRSEANLAEAQRLSHTGSWVINPASRRVLYWSEECYQIWGFDRVQGLPYRAIVLQRIHPDDRDRVHNETQEALRQKKDYTIEFRILLPDGTVKYLEAIGHHLFSAHGELVEVVGTNVDVTDRKRAERVLRESEARLAEAQRELRQMIDTIPVLVVCYSTDARRDFVNAAWKQYTGLSDEAALGTDWSIVAHPDDFATGEKMWRDTLAKGEPVHVQVRLRRADGQYRWFAVERVALRDGSGKVIKWYATAYDIEDRMRAEDRLRRSRTYLDEAQRLSRTGSFGWHIADNLIVWSQETYRIFELDPAVKPTLELVFGRTHPDDSERVRDMIERVAHEDREFDFEHRLLLPDGTIKHLHLRAHRVRFESGEAEVVGALMDITAARKGEEALRRAQAELAHASRVATLGELSASIAHEVHQPLTAIVASGNAAVRWLDREVPENARAIRSVTRMISEAHRASQVILRIRELAKKAEPVMSQVDVNWLIEDVLVLISREATGQRVEVRTQLASELPPVLGDRVQLQQVLINLVMNGIQAMAPVTDRARVLVIRTQRPDANQILVAVEDAGVGIAPENLDRLFGAFYTTKPDGMGMGLSISRSIVETHGGSISATRNSGPGMTFQFTLSVYREQAASLRV